MIKIATLVLAGAALLAAWQQKTPAPEKFTGIVTDTMCGKEHSHMGIKPDAKCVRDCVGDGTGKYKYALLVGDNIYVLSDQKMPAQFAAEKVTVTGTLYQRTKIIKVDKIERAK